MVSKYLLLGPDMIPQEKRLSAERLFSLDEILNYANKSGVLSTQMSTVLVGV